QILRRYRQSDEVADRLVEAVVGAVEVKVGLLVVGALVEIVTNLVVNGHEVVSIDLGAHLDAQVVLVVEVPGRCVAHDLAVARTGYLRAAPETLGKRREAQRRVEPSPAFTI